MLPSEAGGPLAADLARNVEGYVARQPAAVRSAFHAAARFVETTALLRHRRRLVDLDPAQRSAVLERLSLAPGGGQIVDALKVVICLVAGATAYADETRAVAQTAGLARPDAALAVTPSVAWPRLSRCDVVVVGSGAGGATSARALSRLGLDVVIVEEGRRHTVDELRAADPIDRFATLYRDAGSTAALGRPMVILPIGRGVGGTTLVNSGTCYRTPERVLRRWRDQAGLAVCDPSHFNTHLDEIESLLQVAPAPVDVIGRNGEIALRGAQELGWEAAPLRRNAPGCAGSCQCAIGCPRNAKFGVHLNALPEACANGARIVTDARVLRIAVDGAHATGVVAARPDGSSFTILAERVVVAAGATETPPLLRRSGIGHHPYLGSALAVHPAVTVAGRFTEPVVAWRGILQSAGIEQFHETDGILIEATSTPPGMGSMILPGIGPSLVETLASADHLATLGAMVADEPSGRVLGSRRAVVRYDLSPSDGKRLVKAIGIMAKVLFAAGATEVLTGIPGAMTISSPASIGEALGSARPSQLHVAAFHPTGTAGAGSNPSRYPVDVAGRLRGVGGVWVLDASILPTCPEVNPQVSIMALVDALAPGVAT